MAFLLFLNIVTTSFPWSLFPIAALGIPVFIIAVHTFLGDEGANAAREEMRQSRREARREFRREMRGDFGAREKTASQPASPPVVVRDSGLMAQLAQVKMYRQAIDDLVKNASPARKERLAQLASQFADWQHSMEQMAQRLTNFRANSVVQQDLRNVPDSIKKLEDELGRETNEHVRAQISRTLQTRRNQLASLERLQTAARQAEIQLESAVASLGTVYSQALASQSTSTIADYADLAADVNEQVHTMQDQLEALEEVRLGRAANNISG
jgi:hypothetical protein